MCDQQTTSTFFFLNDCTITGVSPELVMFTVHIIQTAHQTITVNCNGAYKAGEITPQSSGTIVSDITITATPAKLAILTLNMVPPWENTSDLYKQFTAINSVVELYHPYGNIWGSDEGGYIGNPGNAAWIQCTDSGKYWFGSSHCAADRRCYVKVTPGKTYNLHAYGRRYKGRAYGFVLTQNDSIEQNYANRCWIEDL